MSYDAQTLRRDLAGGIASALVVLPLALAFGVVSGLGAAAGLYGAVAVGFFAAVFGGTKVQVSGATAPVAVAMSFVVAHYADSGPEALTIIVLAGLIQILLGFLRVGSPGTAQVHCEDPTCGRALSASEGPRGWVVTDQVRISARSTGCTGWS